MGIPRYLHGREVAALLGCSYDAALRIMRDTGEAVKVGALVRVPEPALQSYLDTCRVNESRLSPIVAQVARVGTSPSTGTPVTSRSRRRTRLLRSEKSPTSSTSTEPVDEWKAHLAVVSPSRRRRS